MLNAPARLNRRRGKSVLSGSQRGSCAEILAFFLKIIAFRFPVLKLPPLAGAAHDFHSRDFSAIAK